MSDPVNHPPHYTKHPSGVECVDITELLSFNLGNALKYIWRAKHKGREEEDLKKSLWYVRREQRLVALFPKTYETLALSRPVMLNAQKVLDAETPETLLGACVEVLIDNSEDYSYILTSFKELLEDATGERA